LKEEAGRKRSSDMSVNMTPLIDCVFLLLIFFMIATTFAPMPGIRVKLPPPGAPPPGTDKPQQLILRISDPEAGNPYGTMVLNDNVASMEMLLGNFQRATLKQKEMLIIQSGRRVLHDQIVKVMDLAKRADVKKIGFAMGAR
jgi:biopolymer transport protein ExbD